MNRVCEISGEQFRVEPEDLDFYKTVSPQTEEGTLPIPPPRCAPPTRLRSMLAFRNERVLYQSKCDITGKRLLSMYNPEGPYRVLDREVWWGDDWDACEFGTDFDFSKTFAENFTTLNRQIPKLSLVQAKCDNSDYNNFVQSLKNCYLNVGSAESEDCHFAKNVRGGFKCFDSLVLRFCENSYEGKFSSNCYNCQFFTDSNDCNDCFMIDSCRSCKNCALCFGLTHQEYCILNQPVGREAYEAFIKEWFPLDRKSLSLLKAKFDELKRQFPKSAGYLPGAEDCSGHFAVDCKSCKSCYNISLGEDSKFAFFVSSPMASYDVAHCVPVGTEYGYMLLGSPGSKYSAFSLTLRDSSAAYYNFESFSNSNIFGCSGVRRKQYCILNKSYSQHDYEQLVTKIVGHMTETGEWGEFFDPRVSCFSYNETVAFDYFPLEKNEALRLGYSWNDKLPGTIPKERLSVPGEIEELDKSVCDKIFTCKESGRGFKITPQQFSFHKRLGIPLPELCPDERHWARVKSYPGPVFSERTCAVSGQAVVTNVPESEGEVVSSEVFLDYDFTPTTAIALPRKGDVFELQKVGESSKQPSVIDGKFEPETLASGEPSAVVAGLLSSSKPAVPQPLVAQLEVETQPTRNYRASEGDLVRQEHQSIAQKQLSEALSQLKEKKLLDEDFCSLPDFKGCHGFLLARLTQKSEKLSYCDFDTTANVYLIQFFAGLLSKDSRDIRPHYPGSLLEKVASLNGGEWNLIADTWSAQEEFSGRGLKSEILARVCFGGSSILASEAINSCSEKGFVSAGKSSSIVSLTDLGMLAMDIFQLGLATKESVKDTHASW